MIKHTLAFSTLAPGVIALRVIALGVIAFVAGVYGLAGADFSILLAGLGLLTLLSGVGLLLRASYPWHLSPPHASVIGITLAALALHAYEHVNNSGADLALGFLLWSMLPYALALFVSAFAGIRTSVIAGAAAALALDAWGHYSVFIHPQGSTAALVLLFIPLWSTMIIVPLATYMAWFSFKRRSST